jgi:hypothetical protein
MHLCLNEHSFELHLSGHLYLNEHLCGISI